MLFLQSDNCKKQYAGKKRKLHLEFASLEKASDWVPKQEVQWDTKKLGTDEQTVRVANYGTM